MPPEQQPMPPQVVPTPIPQAQMLPVSYAGFWIRLLAIVLDGAILGIVFIPLSMVLMATLGTDSGSSMGLSALKLALQWGYFITLTHLNQATIGKKLLGLYVVSEDGAHLSLGRIIFRETLGKIISIIILGIGYMMAGFTGKKQALHDKIVSSVVVSNPNNRKTWAFVVSIVLAVILPIIMIVVGIFAAVTLSSLDVAREKGELAGAKAALSSIRAQAELVYDMEYDEKTNKGSYAGVCDDANIRQAMMQAEGYMKATGTCNAEETAYAAYVPLKNATASGWCIDSTGASRESAELGSATVCP